MILKQLILFQFIIMFHLINFILDQSLAIFDQDFIPIKIK